VRGRRRRTQKKKGLYTEAKPDVLGKAGKDGPKQKISMGMEEKRVFEGDLRGRDINQGTQVCQGKKTQKSES